MLRLFAQRRALTMIVALLGLVIVGVACEGPAGPPGAQGPTGPEGGGPTGAAGPRGLAGPAGPEVPTGPDGPTGPAGTKGPTGSAGLEGPAGPAALQGPAGPVGQQGAFGLPGPAGPAGPQGSGGVTGYELILGSVRTIAPGGHLAWEESCPDGKTLLSGGFERILTGGGGLTGRVVDGKARTATIWRGILRNEDSSSTIDYRIVLICAKID